MSEINGKNTADGARPQPAVKPGGKFLVPLAATALVLIVMAAGMHFYIQQPHVRCEKATEELDALVDGQGAMQVESDNAWENFLAGKLLLKGILAKLDELQGKAAEIDRGIGNLEAAVEGNDTCGFGVKRRNASDIAAGVGNTLEALSAAAHLQVFGDIEEGMSNEDIAARLGEETEQLIGKYMAGKRRPGLETPAAPAPEDAEYVFVILVDALRADHLGAYGYARDTSPTLDRLAAEGLLFENAFSQCSTTDTSVASLMTGMYPKTHKMMSSSDWLWEMMLIDNFRKTGYTTGGFSANSLVSEDVHFDNGFDYFEELFWGRAAVTLGQTVRWLERTRTGHKKIFAYIHLMDPHDIYLPPEPFISMFGGGKPINLIAFGLRKLIEEELPALGGTHPECAFDPTREYWDRPEKALGCISLKNPARPWTMEDVSAMVGRYDGEVRYTDSEIAKFLGWLEKNDMLDKSTLVVLADHGESFLEHNQAKHGRVLYDNEIHVPLIFWRGKNNFGGRRVPEPVEVIDTLPTLMGITGVGAPAGRHGRDLLNSKPSENPDPVFSLTWNSLDVFTGEKVVVTAVREFPFKYIYSYKGTGDFYRDEFYDLETDPGEMKDARKEYPGDFLRLKEKLEWWNRATDKKGGREVKEGIGDAKMKKLRDLGYVK